MKIRKGIALLLMAAVTIIALATVSGLDNVTTNQAKERLEEALVRGAVTCYANEGIYPPTLSYLTENYNVKIDKERYFVDYEVFASNVMPQITVIEK